AAPPPDELGTIARRLDRWLPRPDERAAYRDAVGRLLALVAGRTAGANAVGERFTRLYGVLVPAVAWQESCWRQFVERDGQVTYLLSKSGDVWHHAGEPACVAGVLRSRQARVGRRLQRRGGRRDPGPAPDALRRARGERASGECRPRDLRGVQRRARRLPTLPAAPGPARAARDRS